MIERSPCLLVTGWIIFFTCFLGQVCLFVAFLVVHLDNLGYVAWVLFFLPAFIMICRFLLNRECADTDREVRGVWTIWGTYIVAYVITVGMLFGKMANNDIQITKKDTLGINALLGTLCITPALLVLLLQLTIWPSYRKPVLSLSVFAALNIFDGIEMLEIFLMQNEGHFDLNSATETCIVVFACLCFFLSAVGLFRNEFDGNGEVKERPVFGLVEVFLTNLPFLVLRAIVWHKYEAAIFIAKNVVSLVIGIVELFILVGCCKCGD